MQRTKCRWIRTPMGGVKANVVGKELKKLEKKNKRLTPEIVLTSATPKKSILHPCFEWSDKKAAHAHRLEQAGYILRSIEIVVIENNNKETELVSVRAFPNVVTKDNERIYISASNARNNEYYWEQVKNQALAEIDSWKKRYRDIKEFEAVFQAIDGVLAG